MSVKICSIILMVLSVGYAEQKIVPFPPEKLPQFMEVFTKCFIETGVSADVITNVKDGTLSNDKNFGKFLHCSFTKSGYAANDGIVNVDKTTQLFPGNDRKAVKEVVEECNKKTAKNPSEKVVRFYKCFIEKSPVKLGL